MRIRIAVSETTMRDTTELQPVRSTYQALTQRTTDDARTRKIVAERHAAVRRWIDDDDDAACRGID